jgi:hypothetical protein
MTYEIYCWTGKGAFTPFVRVAGCSPRAALIAWATENVPGFVETTPACGSCSGIVRSKSTDGPWYMARA